MRAARAAALLCLLLAASLAVESAAVPSGSRQLALTYRDESIRKVVEDVARATGESFLFDDSLQGRITIMVPQPVSAPEALELLNTALLLRGFAALPAIGGVRKIVRIEEGAAAVPLELRRLREGREGLVATLVPLSAVSAEQLVADLKHLTSSSDAIVAYPPTNSLIAAGSESRLRRLIGLARALDEAAEEELLIRTLRYRSAQTVVEMLGEVFREEPGQGELDMWANARLNAVIVRAPPARLEEVRSFLVEIDRPEEGRGRVYVLPVRNRDPEVVADILNQLASSPGTGGGRTGLEAKAHELAGETLAGRLFDVVVDAATHSLVISADPDTFAVIRQLVDQLDLALHRISVVLTIYEVTTPASLDLGIDAFLPLADPTRESGLVPTLALVPSPGGFPTGPGPGAAFFARYARSPLVLPIVDESGQTVQAVVPLDKTVVITAEARQATARVLQRPHLVLVSGEEHEIFVGENVPILASQGASEGIQTAYQTSVKVERQDVGVRLRVEPTLGEQGHVKLKLDLERSSVSQVSESGDVDQVGPTLIQQRLSSQMILRSGEIAVLGVSRRRGKAEVESGTPWLKDIPGLGWAFRRTSELWVDTRVLFAVEAEVLRSPEEELASSIRRRLAFERHLARVGPLEAADGAPYALRVDTREVEEDAAALAQSLESAGLSTRLSRWRAATGRERFDVYATGFETIAEAGAVSLRLHEAGWHPELVVVSVDASREPVPAVAP